MAAVFVLPVRKTANVLVILHAKVLAGKKRMILNGTSQHATKAEHYFEKAIADKILFGSIWTIMRLSFIFKPMIPAFRKKWLDLFDVPKFR